jgi:hypothetical protein
MHTIDLIDHIDAIGNTAAAWRDVIRSMMP